MVWLAWLVEPPALMIATDASDGTFTMMVCVVSNAGNSDAVEVLVPEIPESMADVATAEIELTLLWLFVLLTSERTVVVGGSLGSIGVLPANFVVDCGCGLTSPRLPSLGAGVLGTSCFPMS